MTWPRRLDVMMMMMMMEAEVTEILALQLVPMQVVEQTAKDRRTPMWTRHQDRWQVEQEQ